MALHQKENTPTHTHKTHTNAHRKQEGGGRRASRRTNYLL